MITTQTLGLLHVLHLSMSRHVQLYPLAVRLKVLVLLDLHHGDRDAVGGEREGRRGPCWTVGRSQDDTATVRNTINRILGDNSGGTHLVIEMVSA